MSTKQNDEAYYAITDDTPLDDLHALHDEITGEIQEIQAQLGAKGAGLFDEDGHEIEFPSPEFWAWRSRAMHALNWKSKRKRVLKTAIRNFTIVARRRSYERVVGVSADDLPALLGAVCKAFRNLARETDAGHNRLVSLDDQKAVDLAIEALEQDHGIRLDFDHPDMEGQTG